MSLETISLINTTLRLPVEGLLVLPKDVLMFHFQKNNVKIYDVLTEVTDVRVHNCISVCLVKYIQKTYPINHELTQEMYIVLANIALF